MWVDAFVPGPVMICGITEASATRKPKMPCTRSSGSTTASLSTPFVSRAESARDRRVRTVALTEKGKKMFLPLFRRHTALIKRAFEDVSPEELQQLEGVLKKVGKRAESLAENPRAILES
jgi:hypothetical protein